jgi:hypothetical protein
VLKTLGKRVHEEQGQMLIMGVLAMTLVLLIGVLVVDFGLWFSGRASVVNAADQAAMSASLNLPKDGAGATATALQYVQANDSEIKPSDVQTTFRCIVGDRNNDGKPDTADITVNCPQLASAPPGTFTCISGVCYALCTFGGANPQCNTIVVQSSKNVPFGFGPAFGVSGAEAAGFTSAACRGACGAAPTLPLDLVMIIDRTGSMSASDLAAAKAGATSVLTIFDPAVQHVALGTLPPSIPANDCQSVNSNSAPGNWVLTGLLGDYQTAGGSLNPSSKIVTDINCLQTAANFGLQTDLGDALKAASDYLQANGRPGVKKGIILLTDGAANVAPAATGRVDTSTGALNCAAQAAVLSNAGDNNGYETNASGACVSGGTVATDANSGTGTQTTCTDTNKDRHKFSSFGLSIPASPTPTIDGIEIKLNSWASSGAATRMVCVDLSWNNGASWTTAKSATIGSNNTTYTLGNSADNWGHTWSASDLSNANFLVRVTDVASNTSTTFNLDGVTANVYYHYTDPSLANLGPCDYAANQSDIVRAAGIEIFTIGYGVDKTDSVCTSVLQGGVEGTSSPFENDTTTQLLAYMAMGDIRYDDGGDGFGGLPGGCPSSGPYYPAAINSENADGDNFLCEPKGIDLQAVFTAAAEALASGTHLVKIPF